MNHGRQGYNVQNKGVLKAQSPYDKYETQWNHWNSGKKVQSSFGHSYNDQPQYNVSFNVILFHLTID